MKKLALLALSVVGAGAHAIVLDGFVDGSYNTGYMTGGGVAAWTAATVAGGIRTTTFNIISNPDDEDARARVRGQVTGGSYSVSAGPGVGVYAELGYGYASGDFLGGNDLNLDLTASNQIRLNFNSNDLPLDTTVLLKSNGSFFAASNALVAASGSPFSQTFTFGGAGLLDVDQIVVAFTNSPSGDFSLSSVEAVPEPASMAILGLGVAAMARRRNRNK